MDKQQAGRVTQKEYNDLLVLDTWREHVEQSRMRRGAGRNPAWGLVKESADAYKDFLGSVCFYYGENARAAEKGARGHRRTG